VRVALRIRNLEQSRRLGELIRACGVTPEAFVTLAVQHYIESLHSAVSKELGVEGEKQRGEKSDD